MTEVNNSLNLRQAGKVETHSALLRSALELFVEKGFENTRISEIAAAAGVAVGTIYLHFGDKEGLLYAILVAVADEIYARVKSVYTAGESDLPEVAAHRHIEKIVEYVEENQRYAPFVFEYAFNQRRTGGRVVDLIVSQVEESIRLCQRVGIYRADIQPLLAARAEVSMNLGLISWWVNHPELAGRAEIIDTLVKFRLSGLHVHN
jgi:AcrR family transcriptional regulator